MSDVKRSDPVAGDIIHVYDGIEEADNSLPSWWLWTLYGAVFFALAYWLGYQAFGAYPQPLEAYAIAKMEAMSTAGPVTEADLTALAADKLMVDSGRTAFRKNCASCHKADGSGQIGPNLTDDVWLHKGGALDIFTTVRDGVPAKGMPPWGSNLGIGTTKQLTAYILTIRGTNLPGKAPQGERWPAETASQ